MRRLCNTYTFFETDSQEVSRLINSFKSKKYSINEVPTFSYQFVADELLPTLSIPYNESVSLDILTVCCKTAKRTPIYKVNNIKFVKNYRPFSSISFSSKIFEKLIYSTLYSFFGRCEIFSREQYGFLKGKSTTDAILSFTDEVYESFNVKKSLTSVFLDFSKAFDTVAQSIPLKKNRVLWDPWSNA